MTTPESTATRTGPRVVDVHAHAAPEGVDALVADQPGFRQQLAIEAHRSGVASASYNRDMLHRLGPALTDPVERFAAMDLAGVDVQVVSPVPMYHAWADRDLGQRIAETANESMAAMSRKDPDRVWAMGTVPLQHPDLAARLLTEAVRDLHLKGVQIGTSAGDRELGDSALEEFWAAAAESAAVVIVHPFGCSLGARLDRHYLSNVIGNPIETTVALSHVVFAGVFDRHPGLRVLGVHGGGYLPTALGRADHAWRVRPESRGCAHLPSHYRRHLWVDALVHDPVAVRHLVETMGVTQVMLGSDYPFDMGSTDCVGDLTRAGLDHDTHIAVLGGNAQRLFGST